VKKDQSFECRIPKSAEEWLMKRGMEMPEKGGSYNPVAPETSFAIEPLSGLK
jgi:hypothetical protein